MVGNVSFIFALPPPLVSIPLTTTFSMVSFVADEGDELLAATIPPGISHLDAWT